MEIFVSFNKEKTKTDCMVQRDKALLPGTAEESEVFGGTCFMIGTVDPEEETFEESLYSSLKDALDLADLRRYPSIYIDADSFVSNRAFSAYVWNTLLDRLTECSLTSLLYLTAVHLSMSMEGDRSLLQAVESAIASPVKEVVTHSYSNWGEVEEKLKKHLMKDPKSDLMKDPKSDPDKISFRDLLKDLILAGPYRKNSEAYKACGISKSTFSKCLNYAIDYKPSKSTVAAFAIGLKLDEESAQTLYHSAGYHLGYTDLTDRIVRFFLKEKIYDIYEVNCCLADYGLPLLGEHAREGKVNITRE